MVDIYLIIVISFSVIVLAIVFTLLIITIKEYNRKKERALKARSDAEKNAREEEERARLRELEERKEAETIKNSPEYKHAFLMAELFSSEIKVLTNSYISHRNIKQINEKYLDTYKYLESIKDKKYLTISKESESLIYVLKDLEEFVKHSNNNFVRDEIRNCKELFDNIDGKSLDRQQREAIVTDEDNELIIAGAGSGKTLTLSGKVQYLLKKRNVSPNKILLISFTKKATDELAERISKGVNGKIDAKTFHALGLKIITQASKKQPKVADEWFCKKFVEGYFKYTVTNNPELVTKIMMFFRSYMSVADGLNRNIPLEKGNDYYFETLRQQDLLNVKKPSSSAKETYSGEHVRSFEELLIANFLFVNGVDYEYEKEYPLSEDDDQNISYHPDFYLPKYDIYLEHFGISRDGKVPWLSPYDEKKYLNGILWKREFHKKHNTTLIETYSYYKSEGILFEVLTDILKKHGVEFKPINLEKMFEQWRSQRTVSGYSDFINLICNFITLYKSRGFKGTPLESLSSMANDYANEFYCERTNLFLEIISPIYEQYQNELKSSGSIDFADMINKATDIIKSNSVDYDYDYILVDEFQDISYDRYMLINTLKNAFNAKIICVGDDWQSIFQYAGSDIGLFTNFEEYFGYSAIMKIENTYRNSQELIDTAGKFVMKNPKQITKELVSSRKLGEPIRIKEYSSYYSDVLLEAIDEIVEKFGNDCDILLLGRTKYDLQSKKGEKILLGDSFYLKSPNDTEKIVCSKYPKLKIRYMTVHKAKGLEADNVIILNLENKRLGFPNKIEDDPLLDLVLVDSDDYLYAEERRLFYVALTRTKNYVYLLVPKSKRRKSFFVNEILGIINPYEEENRGRYYNSEIHSNNIRDEDFPESPYPQSKKYMNNAGFENDSNYSYSGTSTYTTTYYNNNTCKTYTKVYETKYDSEGKPIILCPKCGARMVLRTGKYGLFLGCSRYPECKGTRNVRD